MSTLTNATDGITVDLNRMGILGENFAPAIRIREFHFTDGSFDTRFIGKQGRRLQLDGEFSRDLPRAPAYAPEPEWTKLVPDSWPGPWVYSRDTGSSYRIESAAITGTEMVEGRPLVMRWRISLREVAGAAP